MEQLGGPPRTNRCLDSAAGDTGASRSFKAVVLGLAALGLMIMGTTAMALSAPSTVVDLAGVTHAPNTRSRYTPSRRSSGAKAPGKVKTSIRRKTPLHLPGREWPTGEASKDLALIATNILPDDTQESTAVLLDVKSERYVQLSPGDHLGKLEVVKISLDWVQLRGEGTSSWVGYRKSAPVRRRARNAAPRPPPPNVRRRKKKGPSVTYKWIVGRLNLAGELRDHLRPKLTAKGLQIGRVTTGFRRIGLRVGDVVQRSGGFDVHSLEQLRNGMQKAAKHGGSGTMTVLRAGRTVKLDYNVR